MSSVLEVNLLRIDGRSYSLPETTSRPLVAQLGEMAIAEYEKLDDNWQFLAKPIARTILQKMEEGAKKKGATKEQYLSFRPEKRADPCIHLIKIACGLFFEATKRVELNIETDGDCISAFSCEIINPGESRGQMVTHGDIRERKDNCIKVS